MCFYPFMVNLDRCSWSCNTFDDSSGKICVTNKTQDININICNLITRISKWKTLTKCVSWECKYKSESRKCNSNQKWNNSKCWCECKNPREHHLCEKDYIWNPRTCTCENDKYLEIIIDESVIMWDELIGVIQSEPTKILPISLNYGKVTCHLDNFYILLAVSLITILLLIIMGI